MKSNTLRKRPTDVPVQKASEQPVRIYEKQINSDSTRNSLPQ